MSIKETCNKCGNEVVGDRKLDDKVWNCPKCDLVEVEFNSLEEAEAFIPPAWFGEEVTGNKQYSNAQLALAVI